LGDGIGGCRGRRETKLPRRASQKKGAEKESCSSSDVATGVGAPSRAVPTTKKGREGITQGWALLETLVHELPVEKKPKAAKRRARKNQSSLENQSRTKPIEDGAQQLLGSGQRKKKRDIRGTCGPSNKKDSLIPQHEKGGVKPSSGVRKGYNSHGPVTAKGKMRTTN